MLHKTMQILGITISTLSRNDLLLTIKTHLTSQHNITPVFITTINPEIIMHAQHDTSFAHILNTSSIQTADGIGVIWAARYLHGIHLERITGIDLMIDIAQHAAQASQSIFLLGAQEGIAEKAAYSLQQQIPRLHMIETYAGNPLCDFNKLPQAVQEKIKRAHIIFVAYGAPHQEQWIYRNLPHLSTCKIAIGVGGAFNFIAGKIKRAPLWLQKLGLEWLYRLYQEPWRIQRMSKLPFFVAKVIRAKISFHKKTLHD